MRADADTRPAADLAIQAFNATPTVHVNDFADDALEAAAMLRDGWRPGERMVPL